MPVAFYSGMLNILLDTVYAIICEPDHWTDLFKHAMHPKSLAGSMIGRLHWNGGKRLFNLSSGFMNRAKRTSFSNQYENDVRKNRDVLKQALADLWAGRGGLMKNYVDLRDQIEGAEFWKTSHPDELGSQAESQTPFAFAVPPNSRELCISSGCVVFLG